MDEKRNRQRYKGRRFRRSGSGSGSRLSILDPKLGTLQLDVGLGMMDKEIKDLLAFRFKLEQERMTREALPPKRQPHRLTGCWSGGPEEYFLFLSVFDKDGQYIPRILVRLIYNSPQQNPSPQDLYTEEWGGLVLAIKVLAGERWFFRATLPGTDVKPIKRMLGEEEK